MKPGSARDLHAEHIKALAAKQGTTDPEPSPVLGPRGDRGAGERERGGGRGGGDARREGPGWGGDRGDWDRYGDRCVRGDTCALSGAKCFGGGFS